MQINRISPPAGFIIISHFNEAATDIKTTRSLRVVLHRGAHRPPPDGSAGNDWNTEAAFRGHVPAEFTGRARLENNERIKK